MKRLAEAARNSARACRHLMRHEAAIRLEVMLLAAAVPVAYLIAPGWRGFALLVGSILVLLIVEIINTAIEAACNAITIEHNADIRLAKDCGSLAVALSAVLAAGAWALALLDWFAGL
jgi:diacylglycerol kinase (ATP)